MQSKWIHIYRANLKESNHDQAADQAKSSIEEQIKLRHMDPLLHFRENMKDSQSKANEKASGLASAETDEHPDVQEAKSMYEGGYRLPHPIWTDNEVSSVQITHKPPKTVRLLSF